MTRTSLFALGAAVALSVQLDAQSVHYEGAVSLASGTYIFTERTTSWTFSNGLALSAGPFTLRTTVPFFIQNSTLLTRTTTGFLPTGGSHSGAVRDSSTARGGQKKGQGPSMQVVRAEGSLAAGSAPVEVPSSAVPGYTTTVGDPTVSLSVSGGGLTSVAMSAGVKIPATDTTNFGTGEWDVGGSVGVSRFVGGSTLLSLDVSYWHLGDPPDLDLTDPIMGSVSVAYLSLSGWGGSLTASGARSVIEGFDDSYSLSAAVTRVSTRAAIGLTGSIGFTETAPDFTLGINWRIALTH